jgi:cob(I)alamin adenosyltransferase
MNIERKEQMKYEKLYTRKGDTGKTKLWSGEEVKKNTSRIRALSLLDCFHSKIGLAITHSDNKLNNKLFETIVEALISFMASVSNTNDSYEPDLKLKELEKLHKKLIRATSHLNQTHWIRYGTSGKAAAFIDDACTWCRFCESMIEGVDLTEDEMKFLNMTSKLLFIAARNDEPLDS